MTIGAFAMLTFGQAQNWKANEAANTLADMEEWMNEDIANGRIDQELGQEYIDNLQNVLRLVLTIDDESACLRDSDISFDKANSRSEVDSDPTYYERKEKRQFTLIKFVIIEPIALNDSIN